MEKKNRGRVGYGGVIRIVGMRFRVYGGRGKRSGEMMKGNEKINKMSAGRFKFKLSGPCRDMVENAKRKGVKKSSCCNITES